MLKRISKFFSVFVGLTIINVWLFRAERSTSYRGGNATNLMDEFEVYGLDDYFLIIGVLGSYTTFSSFSYEVIELYNNKKLLLSIIYILASVFSCIVAAYAGYSINKV